MICTPDQILFPCSNQEELDMVGESRGKYRSHKRCVHDFGRET